MTFFFQPANITNQILNFGLPAPIDLQVVGRDADANYKIARSWRGRIARIPGAADVHIHQVVASRRSTSMWIARRPAQLGLTQHDVTSSMLISLSGSGQVAPNYWLNLVEWRQLQRGRADAAVPDRFAGRAAAHAHFARCRARSTRTTPGSQAGRRPPAATVLWARRPAGRRRRTEIPARWRRSTQLLSNLVAVKRELCSGDREPLQRDAGVRRLRQRGPPRPGQASARRCEKIMQGGEAHLPRGHHVRAARPDARPCSRRSSAWGWG